MLAAAFALPPAAARPLPFAEALRLADETSDAVRVRTLQAVGADAALDGGARRAPAPLRARGFGFVPRQPPDGHHRAPWRAGHRPHRDPRGGPRLRRRQRADVLQAGRDPHAAAVHLGEDRRRRPARRARPYRRGSQPGATAPRRPARDCAAPTTAPCSPPVRCRCSRRCARRTRTSSRTGAPPSPRAPPPGRPCSTPRRRRNPRSEDRRRAGSARERSRGARRTHRPRGRRDRPGRRIPRRLPRPRRAGAAGPGRCRAHPTSRSARTRLEQAGAKRDLERAGAELRPDLALSIAGSVSGQRTPFVGADWTDTWDWSVVVSVGAKATAFDSGASRARVDAATARTATPPPRPWRRRGQLARLAVRTAVEAARSAGATVGGAAGPARSRRGDRQERRACLFENGVATREQARLAEIGRLAAALDLEAAGAALEDAIGEIEYCTGVPLRYP